MLAGRRHFSTSTSNATVQLSFKPSDWHRRWKLFAKALAMNPLRTILTAMAIVAFFDRAVIAAAINGGAFDPFDYPSSPSPANQIIAANNLNGGFGWNAGGDSSPNAATANWENAATLPAPTGATASRTISAGSLSYPAVGYPASTGNRATLVGSGGTNNSVARSLGQLVDSGTFYFSYLTKRNEDTMRTTSLAFFGPANGIAGTPGNQPERFAIGQIGTPTAGSGSTFGDIGALMNNVNTSTTNNILYGANPVAYGTGVTHLIAGRIDFNPTGPDTLRLYVDPQNVTAEPATPYIQSNAYELSSFN
jgi:hypothetical protein